MQLEATHTNSMAGPNGFHDTALCDITFTDIIFSVPLKGPGSTAKERKNILKGISGRCVPGRLLAIMGSSGAGKTTVRASV